MVRKPPAQKGINKTGGVRACTIQLGKSFCRNVMQITVLPHDEELFTSHHTSFTKSNKILFTTAHQMLIFDESHSCSIASRAFSFPHTWQL
jgi:hypothetical protein